MLNLNDYVTTNADGSVSTNTEKFTADFDRYVNSSCETAVKNALAKNKSSIEQELRKSIEEEAKLSAEERANKALAEREQALLAKEKAFNVAQIKSLYKKDNLFSDEEIAGFENFITDDYEKSVEIANILINARTKRNEEYKQKFIEEMQVNTPRSAGNGKTNTESDIAKLAKSYAEKNAEKTAVVEL